MHIINYDKIYSRYNDNLLKNLRGFNNKISHLDDWIPSENIIDSLFDLIKNLYKSRKETKIKIIFSESKNFKTIENFYEKVKNDCKIKFEKNEKLSLTISDIDIVYFSSYKKKKYTKKNINKIQYSLTEKKINLLFNIDPKTYKSKFEITKQQYKFLKNKTIYSENSNFALLLNLNKNKINEINFYLKKKNIFK